MARNADQEQRLQESGQQLQQATRTYQRAAWEYVDNPTSENEQQERSTGRAHDAAMRQHIKNGGSAEDYVI